MYDVLYILLQNGALQAEIAALRGLEEQINTLTDQLDESIIQMQRIQHDKNSLIEKNEELAREIRSLHNIFDQMSKENRYSFQTTNAAVESINGRKKVLNDSCYCQKI